MSDDPSPKAPVLEVVLFGGLAIILLSAMVRWDRSPEQGGLRAAWNALWGRNPVVVPPAPNQIATSQPIIPGTPTDTAAIAPGVPVAPQPTSVTAMGGPADPVLPAGTHQVICGLGYGGLNLRSQAGLSMPLAVMPCGTIVTVTGDPVTVQNETWSPVFYANQNGWAATRLLRSIR